MFHVLSWSVIGAVLALWSLTVWLLHAVAVWTVSSAGALSGAGQQAGAVALPDWLPPEMTAVLSSMAGGLGALVDGLLQTAPVLAGGLTVLAWGAWGLVGLALLLLGLGLHLAISAWQRGRGPGPGPMGGPSMARG